MKQPKTHDIILFIIIIGAILFCFALLVSLYVKYRKNCKYVSKEDKNDYFLTGLTMIIITLIFIASVSLGFSDKNKQQNNENQ